MIPYDIVYRDFPESEAVTSVIEKHIEKIEKFGRDQIVSCHVVVASPHKHQNKGKIYHIQIRMHVGQKDIIVDQMLHSLRSFSSFFMPFYFFNSGLKMPYDAFSIESLQIAFLFLFISAPLKTLTIVLHRRITQKESYKDSFAVAISLIPNLVFGLVLADILKNKMNIPLEVYGGLIIYTLFITLASPMVLKFIPNKDALNLVEMNTIPINLLEKTKKQ